MTDREFLCEYPFGRDGARWALSIFAADEGEALARLKAVGAYGVVLGVCHGRIRGDVPGAGVFVRLLAAFRNWRGRP